LPERSTPPEIISNPNPVAIGNFRIEAESDCHEALVNQK
jgi:hypothetical protein